MYVPSFPYSLVKSRPNLLPVSLRNAHDEHTIVKDRDFCLDMQGVSTARVINVVVRRRVPIAFFVDIDDRRATQEVQPSSPN